MLLINMRAFCCLGRLAVELTCYVTVIAIAAGAASTFQYQSIKQPMQYERMMPEKQFNVSEVKSSTYSPLRNDQQPCELDT